MKGFTTGVIRNCFQYIPIESEDSAVEAMETRAVEIIKKLKEHINDDMEYGG
ncbi:hypothetical protein wTkk_000752 [Wolbachia endosymbiont of Trichogramma kaykai]